MWIPKVSPSYLIPSILALHATLSWFPVLTLQINLINPYIINNTICILEGEKAELGALDFRYYWRCKYEGFREFGEGGIWVWSLWLERELWAVVACDVDLIFMGGYVYGVEIYGYILVFDFFMDFIHLLFAEEVVLN